MNRTCLLVWVLLTLPVFVAAFLASLVCDSAIVGWRMGQDAMDWMAEIKIKRRA